MNDQTESVDPRATEEIPARMPAADPHEVTQLLGDWSRGNARVYVRFLSRRSLQSFESGVDQTLAGGAKFVAECFVGDRP